MNVIRAIIGFPYRVWLGIKLIRALSKTSNRV